MKDKVEQYYIEVIGKMKRRFTEDDTLVEVNRNISKELDFEIDKLKKIKGDLENECMAI
jgi:uncharacterized protein (DUF2132 family)